MQEVVDVPGLVADHRSYCSSRDDVVEHHEVVDEDLVHAPQRLERVQVVLLALAVDVRRLAGQDSRRRMDPLAAASSTRGHRVLRQPVDLQVRVQLAQLVGDRDVPLRVAEADRRGDVERALRPAQRPRSTCAAAAGTARGDRSTKSREEEVGQHRVAGRLDVAAALDVTSVAAGQLGERGRRSRAG